MILEKCNGPACPRCGCRDAQIIQEPPEVSPGQQRFAGDALKHQAWQHTPWWGSGRACCRHCRTVFSFRELPADEQDLPEAEPEAPPPDPATCPKCGGGEYLAYTTKGKTQFRKCKGCNHKGKTIKPSADGIQLGSQEGHR